jgi:hypothetical protein
MRCTGWLASTRLAARARSRQPARSLPVHLDRTRPRRLRASRAPRAGLHLGGSALLLCDALLIVAARRAQSPLA